MLRVSIREIYERDIIVARRGNRAARHVSKMTKAKPRASGRGLIFDLHAYQLSSVLFRLGSHLKVTTGVAKTYENGKYYPKRRVADIRESFSGPLSCPISRIRRVQFASSIGFGGTRWRLV